MIAHEVAGDGGEGGVVKFLHEIHDLFFYEMCNAYGGDGVCCLGLYRQLMTEAGDSENGHWE